jgi:hypothetical protein
VDRRDEDKCKDSGLRLGGRFDLVLLGRVNVNPEGRSGQSFLAGAENDVSESEKLGEGLGILGVRRTRGVTGERQLKDGDDKKDVEVPVAKLSRNDLGRSMLRLKYARRRPLLAQIHKLAHSLGMRILTQRTPAKSDTKRRK